MRIIQRLYDDFLRPSLYDEYERIISEAKREGYKFYSILSFEQSYSHGEKAIIIRRDVDSKDVPCLRRMLEIEKKYGAISSNYFRLHTINDEIIQDIMEAGGEASYHYEEIASYCYKHHIRNKERVQSCLDNIRSLFISNLTAFRKKTGQPCYTLASHGDYVNIKLDMPNYILLNDEVRNKCGIIREAYDKEHLKYVTKRFADHSSEDFVNKVLQSIDDNEEVIELLIHPRHWNSPAWINFKEEINRICKQLYMWL